ncbi:hypothetical protein [Algibacter sp. R77976]|uniref:hypothetical protein n=1 Tax=Algibacter sp. R77976 TaxID=3093873 RepID=UPI0037CBD424
MYKILIFIALSAVGLNAQSKLYPNNDASISLEQSILDNTLSLSEPESIINKVFFYNKETLDRTIYDNVSNSIDINLDELLPGLYTVMVYVDGDIIVFRVDVRLGVKDKIKDVIQPMEVALELEEKPIKYYRAISTVNHQYSQSKFNVFTEKQKNNLIRKNVFDLVSYTGKKNTLVLYAVYNDNSEELVYETEAPKEVDLFNNGRVLANVK